MMSAFCIRMLLLGLFGTPIDKLPPAEDVFRPAPGECCGVLPEQSTKSAPETKEKAQARKEEPRTCETPTS